MGRDKALMKNGDESQLARAVRLLGVVCDDVYVSARAEQADEPERARFPLIVDRYDDMGPVAGLLSAMETHPTADWLVVACDLPNLDARTLSFLLDNADADSPFVAYRSVHNGLPEPLCALYRAGSEAIVRRFAEDGVICPRKIMINSDTCLLEQPEASALDNMNTPEDLQRTSLRLS